MSYEVDYDNLLDDSDLQPVIEPQLPTASDPDPEPDDIKDTPPAFTPVTTEGGYMDEDDLLEGVGEGNQATEDHLDSSLVMELLRAKGINPDAIKVQDEDTQETIELKFSDLSKEEQLEILSYTQEPTDDLYDHEIEAVQFLRENQMSLEDLVNTVKQQTINEMQAQMNRDGYTVDGMTDEEVFIADYLNNYGDDHTDEELQLILDQNKSNEELFAKKVNKIRENSRQYEDSLREQELATQRAAEEQREQEYINQVVQLAHGMNDMHDTVELENSDKNEILNFMFTKNPNGQTEMDKALLSPEQRYKAAWYLKYGDQTIRDVHNYYKSEIARLSRLVPRNAKPQSFVKPRK